MSQLNKELILIYLCSLSLIVSLLEKERASSEHSRGSEGIGPKLSLICHYCRSNSQASHYCGGDSKSHIYVVEARSCNQPRDMTSEEEESYPEVSKKRRLQRPRACDNCRRRKGELFRTCIKELTSPGLQCDVCFWWS
jgi:hypothetical protein